ncbi:MFS transporter [Streptomyces turgidiscabies]|uniref:Transporter, major facilitator family protein n=2 Tax=Streptomyces turgidiscabies TaxID=85558 RepID=L7ERZ0_STRT8|nr:MULTISPECIES: MFS transporter [Streptomyces]ELP61797.1 transporter, major facilitator family protein [Streptomyces turgidiscabies Car8]MDX3493314.1 MFS transporter [Streptomyces turgidiscabies]BAP59934.1 putative major facilitator superfamily transporter [Streptomyces turgidiscabies]GAQ70617.1 putative multidrug-efflux transporter/MT1297 [Streptomyces turgidiscabies]
MKSEILRPLSLPAFRRVWIGQALSTVGDGMFVAALAAAVLEDRSGSDLGLVLGAESLALVVVALGGGVLADRLRRSRLMIASDVLRLLCVVGFALGAAQGSLLLAAVLAAGMGFGSGLFRPAHRALLPTLAPGLLPQANALLSATSRIAMIAGPALGGVLLAVSNARTAFWIDVATFGVSIVALMGIRDARPQRQERTSVLAEAGAGFRAVLDRPWVAAIIAQGTAQLILVMAPMLVLLPIYLSSRGQMPHYGLMLGLQAAGSAVGGLTVGARPPRRPGTVGVLGLGLGGVQLAFMMAGVPIALLGFSVFLTGLGYGLFGVLWATALQRSIPDELLGRVFAVEMLGTYALEPVGLALAPMAADVLGLRTVLTVALLALVATTVLPLFVPGVRTFADPEPSSPKKPELQPETAADC